jgi:hypothetical protein
VAGAVFKRHFEVRENLPEDGVSAVITVVWEFDEQSWRDELSRAALQAALNGVRQQLGEVRCPVHGESPTIVVRGRSEGTMSLDVHGYCDQSTEPVRALLAELEGGGLGHGNG